MYICICIYIHTCIYDWLYIYICVPASLCCAEIIADFFPQSVSTGTARTRSWTAAKRREAEATLQTVTFWNTQTHSVLVCGPVADMGVFENRVGYTKKVWPIGNMLFLTSGFGRALFPDYLPCLCYRGCLSKIAWKERRPKIWCWLTCSCRWSILLTLTMTMTSFSTPKRPEGNRQKFKCHYWTGMTLCHCWGSRKFKQPKSQQRPLFTGAARNDNVVKRSEGRQKKNDYKKKRLPSGNLT